MDEIYNQCDELANMRKQINNLTREYAQKYKRMLINFLKLKNLDGYVQIEDCIGILKVDKDEASSFPYVIKFYPLRDDGIPSIKSKYFHCLMTNDFNDIEENVKAVELEFID